MKRNKYKGKKHRKYNEQVKRSIAKVKHRLEVGTHKIEVKRIENGREVWYPIKHPTQKKSLVSEFEAYMGMMTRKLLDMADGIEESYRVRRMGCSADRNPLSQAELNALLHINNEG